MSSTNKHNGGLSLEEVALDLDFANKYPSAVLDASSIEQICDAYAKVDAKIKERIAERQSKTKALKDEVSEIERPYRPVIKELEKTKDRIHKEISQRLLKSEKLGTKYVGELMISEIEPQREFHVFDIKEVPLEFLRIDEEHVNAYVDLYGRSPDGILMCEKRQCRIVHKKTQS